MHSLSTELFMCSNEQWQMKADMSSHSNFSLIIVLHFAFGGLNLGWYIKFVLLPKLYNTYDIAIEYLFQLD